MITHGRPRPARLIPQTENSVTLTSREAKALLNLLEQERTQTSLTEAELDAWRTLIEALR